MMKRINITILLVILFLSVKGFTLDRKTLLFVNEIEGTNIYIFELKSTGELTYTNQSINVGFLSPPYIAISPEQKFLWTAFYDTTFFGMKQFELTSYGQISATGRFVSLSTGIGLYDMKFTPNSEMLLLGANNSIQPVFRTYPDGSIMSTANFYSSRLFISKRGDINAVKVINYRRVDKIDYNTFSVTSLQQFPVYGSMEEAVYTPNGAYITMSIFGASTDDVEIWAILPDGRLDTTRVQMFDIGNPSGHLDITPNGTHIYAGCGIGSPQQGIMRLDWYSQDTPFINTGILTPLSDPWQIKVSPDGNILTAVSQDNSSYPSKQYLRTFFIQADGSLVDTGYSFPFTDTFGDYVNDLQFVYPPAPTDIPKELWLDLK